MSRHPRRAEGQPKHRARSRVSMKGLALRVFAFAFLGLCAWSLGLVGETWADIVLGLLVSAFAVPLIIGTWVWINLKADQADDR